MTDMFDMVDSMTVMEPAPGSVLASEDRHGGVGGRVVGPG